MVRMGLIAALLACSAGMALAGPEGRVRVIDGDTIEVAGETVRLFGIDAPERDQTCWADGRQLACGAWVADEVRALFEGRRATCATREFDRYGRIVARCAVEGRDMGEVIVARGLAIAYRRYSELYVEAEKAAVLAGRGIHATDFTAPADHRAARAPAPQPAPGVCRIKGNISSSGRIYHMPGQADYDATRINEARGERWFCSESEAQAAGWRRARR